MEHENESPASKAQKELVDKLTKRLHYLENQRTLLTKFVMDEGNVESLLLPRANEVLIKLKSYITYKREELSKQDAIWLGLELDDLEVEISKPDTTNAPG